MLTQNLHAFQNAISQVISVHQSGDKYPSVIPVTLSHMSHF